MAIVFLRKGNFVVRQMNDQYISASASYFELWVKPKDGEDTTEKGSISLRYGSSTLRYEFSHVSDDGHLIYTCNTVPDNAEKMLYQRRGGKFILYSVDYDRASQGQSSVGFEFGNNPNAKIAILSALPFDADINAFHTSTLTEAKYHGAPQVKGKGSSLGTKLRAKGSLTTDKRYSGGNDVRNASYSRNAQGAAVVRGGAAVPSYRSISKPLETGFWFPFSELV